MRSSTNSNSTATTKPLIAACGILTRVSTAAQADDGQSLETQETRGRATAARLSLPVYAVYPDAGVSGDLFHSRPALQRALADMKAGKIKVLIVSDESRLSWSTEHFPRIIREITIAGGRVFMLSIGTFIDPEDCHQEFGLDVKTAANKFMRRHAAKLSLENKRELTLKGVQCSRSRRPWGYHIVTKADVIRGFDPHGGACLDGDAGTYRIISAEAEHVRRVYHWYAWEGASLREIAARLNSERVPVMRPDDNKHGVWCHAVIRGILCNPVYKGEAQAFAQKRYKFEERVGLPTGRGTGAEIYKSPVFCVPTPQESRLTVPCPAIVPLATWERAQERRESNQQTLVGAPLIRDKYLLSGLVFCPVCGTRLESEGSNKGCPVFKCRHSVKGGRGCIRFRFRMRSMEPVVTQAIQYVATRPDILTNAVREWQQECRKRLSGDGDAVEVAAQRERLERRLEGLEKKRQALVVAEGLTPEILVAALADLSTETAKVDAALDALKASDAETEARQAEVFDPETLAAEARVHLLGAERILLSDKLPMRDRREALRALVDAVTPVAPEDPDYRPAKNEAFPHSLSVRLRPLTDSETGVFGACVVIHATMDGHFDVRVQSATTSASSDREVAHA